VQLANFQAGQKDPYASAWAELREAQSMTLSLPRTGMAVITDIGDPKDIHPANKQDVGRRLALIARAMVHGHKVPFAGPTYKSMKVEGDRIRLQFSHTADGLEAAGGGPLKDFAIAGEDRRFVSAKAQIDGDTVVVHSETVPQPVAVRYAWSDAPEGNLFNKAGLPASPFRTDDWPGITSIKK
jgi:sialate O-acetylesterase